jgi:hypothetical protein
MASRPHTTYKKRQKELARMEKQRDKVAKRQQRKLEKNPDGVSFLIEGVDGETIDPDNPTPFASGPTEDTESPAQTPEDPPRDA